MLKPTIQGEAELRQRTEEKLRSYLQLMDALINTIPNPISSRMWTAFFGAATGLCQRHRRSDAGSHYRLPAMNLPEAFRRSWWSA